MGLVITICVVFKPFALLLTREAGCRFSNRQDPFQFLGAVLS